MINIKNKLLIKLDYLLYRYSYLLPMNLADKYNFPSKRLLKYCWENWSKKNSSYKYHAIKYKYEMIAHMYTYDSTVSVDDLSLIHRCHNTHTKERVRQILAKFVRIYYN